MKKMTHITDLKGVYSAAVRSGIKSQGLDLAFIYVPDACGSAGTFTMNKFMAPCLQYTKEVIAKNVVKAVIINSGCANAATGRTGFRNARQTAAWAARMLDLKPSEVAVASTGIIGVQLPMQKVERGLKDLLRAPRARKGGLAARAIMTTDTCPKEIVVRGRIGKETVTVAGIAKGAGMIAPNMATMLSYLVTDAKLSSRQLQPMLSAAVKNSFNMASVDGDTSTNDMVLLFANGAKHLPGGKKALRQFAALLEEACRALAKMIVTDGEGATKLIEVRVTGAASEEDARKIARSVTNSPLVKTAIHGADPNWGRVVAAAGKVTGVKLDPKRLDLYFGAEKVLSRGKILKFNTGRVVRSLKQKKVFVHLHLNLSKGSAVAWGCDLTKGYIEANVQYN